MITEELINRFEKIILDWLKSGNENATYVGHLCAEEAEAYLEQETKELKLKVEGYEMITPSYWEGYRDGFNSSYDDSVDYFKNKEQ